MTEETYSNHGKKVGRTWADLVVGGSYITAGLLFIGGICAVSWWLVGTVPGWVLIAILGSLAFIPFLQERAKEGSQLFVVLDGPMRMTEWRVGKRVPMEIDGAPITFRSKSGVSRSLLVDFDPIQYTAKGSMLAECSQFDQIRDLSTVQRMSQSMQSLLEEDRLTMMHVGIEVEKRNREVVDWALRLIMEGSIPSEITDALGVDGVEEPKMTYDEDMEEVLNV